MRAILANTLVLSIFVLSACQVTTYTDTLDGVRTAVTYEDSSKRRVLVKKFEKFDAITGEWFEAEKLVDGRYVLTKSGQSARKAFIANEETSSGGY